MYYYSHAHVDTGSPKALIGMIEILDKKKFKPYFLETIPGPLIEVLENMNVEVVKHKVLNKFSIKNIFGLFFLFRKYNIKIFHVNEFMCSKNLVLAAWLARVTLVLHVHNPVVLSRFNVHAILADKVLMGSEFTKSQIQNYKYITHKSQVIYNYIDFAQIENAKNQRKEFGIKKSEIAIGVVGQIAPQKGQDKIVSLAKQLLEDGHSNVKFFMCGRVHEGCEAFYENEIKGRIKHLGLEKNVIILGVIDNVPSLLKSIDIFILLTKTENFCLAVAEAMAANLPIISQKVGAIPELLNKTELGFLVDDDAPIEVIYSHLKELILDSSLRKRMGDLAKASMVNRLDFAGISHKLNDFYSKIS